MPLSRLFAVFATLLMGAAIVYAVLASTPPHPDFLAAFAKMGSFPWGQVTLLDLYITFGLFAVVIGLFEQRWTHAALWIAALFILGGFLIAFWLALRWPELARRLRAPTKP
jgi:hypothetical protein